MHDDTTLPLQKKKNKSSFTAKKIAFVKVEAGVKFNNSAI